ncbi:unnamed protein product [Colias eurytheme]|nr:unnamed protein product [Colias eurytheme]
MNESVVVNSTVALWFRIARVFGMAPVSIRSDRDGYRVSVCNYAAVYGYFVGVVFCLCYIGYTYNVIRTATLQVNDRWMWFWALDYGVSLVIIESVVVGGAREQSVMISDLIQLDKINSQVDSCYAEKSKNKRQNTYIIFGVLSSYLVMQMKIAFDLRILDSWQFKCFAAIVQLEYCVLFAVKIRLFILNMEIKNSLQIINEELLRLYGMIGSDIELTSQVFAWSLSRRLRVLCHSYWSTIAIYRRANKANEIKTIVIFFLHAYRLTIGVYLVEKTCVTLKRFKYRAENFGKKVVKQLKIFSDLALEKAYCTPLGVCTIESSLVATTITAIVTSLAVVFQFQTLD